MMAIVVLAALCVWGIAMLDLGGAAPRVESGNGQEPVAELPAPAQPVPRPRRPEASAQDEESPSTPSEPALPAGEDGVGADVLVESDLNAQRVGGGPTARQNQVEQLAEEPPPPRRAPDEGEGYLSPEFVESQTDYSYEPRSKSSRPKERRLRDLLRAAGLGPRVQIVNCRSSVCRLQVEMEAGQSLSTLLEVPGLAEELKIDDTTPYSLRAGQLSIYGSMR